MSISGNTRVEKTMVFLRNWKKSTMGGASDQGKRDWGAGETSLVSSLIPAAQVPSTYLGHTDTQA